MPGHNQNKGPIWANQNTWKNKNNENEPWPWEAGGSHDEDGEPRCWTRRINREWSRRTCVYSYLVYTPRFFSEE